MLHHLLYDLLWLRHWLHLMLFLAGTGILNAILWCWGEVPTVIFDRVAEKVFEHFAHWD
jgi:hypothetical protein